MNASTENQIWSDLLQTVEKRLNRQIFETWFRPIKFEGCDHQEKVLHLHAPTKISKDWVNSNYAELMRQSLKEIDLSNYKIDWTYDEIETEPQSKEEVSRNNAPTFDRSEE